MRRHKKSGPISAANTDEANHHSFTYTLYTILIEIARGMAEHGA